MGGTASTQAELAPINSPGDTSINYGGNEEETSSGGVKGNGGCLDRYFKISERGSTVRTELIAGAINFVANSYLLVLMPKILEQGGVDPKIAISAFVLSTSMGSLMVGLLANLPVPVGPGLGCAAFFAYGLTGSRTTVDRAITEMGITCCLLSGCVMLVLGVLDLPRRIFGIVPIPVKHSMPIGLGLLLSLCGFQQMGLVVADPYTGVRMSTSIGVSIILGAAGAIAMAFVAHRAPKELKFTQFVGPIAFFTLVSWSFGLSPWPEGLITTPVFGETLINFHELGKFFWSPVFGLFMICMFDIGGIVESVCGFADSMDAAKRRKPLITPDGVRGEYWVYFSCGVSSLVSAYLGATPVIAFGESFAGIEVGGRTGLTSVVTAMCFLLSLPFEPIFRAVPLYASAPVLVLLGVILLKLIVGLKLQRMITAFPAFCTIALMPYLYSIDKAIWAGLICWACLNLLELIFNYIAPQEESAEYLFMDIDTTIEKLESMRGQLRMSNRPPPCTAEVGDLLRSACHIVRIAEEQLNNSTAANGKPSALAPQRSVSAIHTMLTPKISCIRGEAKTGGDESPMYPNLDGPILGGHDDLSYQKHTDFFSPHKSR